MDLTLDIDDYKLNIRAAGIIIHNNKVLVHRNINNDYYALIGGRVMIGENSADTVRREVFEELGKKVEIIGYISTIENFFTKEDKKYHEIMFIHKLEFVNNEDRLIDYTLNNIEGKDHLKYMWLDINKIDEYNITPNAIKDILKDEKFPVHKINIV